MKSQNKLFKKISLSILVVSIICLMAWFLPIDGSNFNAFTFNMVFGLPIAIIFITLIWDRNKLDKL
jgi:hypothetical protein